MTRLDVWDLPAAEGRDLGVTAPVTVEQEQTCDFGRVTHDLQWIHVDPQRAAAGPFGGPIVHGFHTLALASTFTEQLIEVTGTRLRINYGLDRVRFPSPAPVGSSLTCHGRIQQVTPTDHGFRVVHRLEISASGADKPTCVADFVVLYVPEDPAPAPAAG